MYCQCRYAVLTDGPLSANYVGSSLSSPGMKGACVSLGSYHSLSATSDHRILGGFFFSPFLLCLLMSRVNYRESSIPLQLANPGLMRELSELFFQPWLPQPRNDSLNTSWLQSLT